MNTEEFVSKLQAIKDRKLTPTETFTAQLEVIIARYEEETGKRDGLTQAASIITGVLK